MTNPYNVEIFGLNAVVYASNKEEAIKYAQNVIKEHKRQFVRNEIMTLEEVVDALNISKQYLYRLKNEGKLIPFISNKGTNIYWKDDVLQYAQSSSSRYKDRLTFIENNAGNNNDN